MTTIHDWLREQGLSGGYRTGSLRAVAERVHDGEDFRFALREFLDDVNLAVATQPSDVAKMIAAEPPPLEHRGQHAFLGALAEHLAMLHDLPRPQWAVHEDRFLDSWWFPAQIAAYDAIAIRESPPAFRRRGIFLPISMLERV